MCAENIFFKTKKPSDETTAGETEIALRKCKGRKMSLTAGQLKQGSLERLTHHDEETNEHGN